MHSILLKWVGQRLSNPLKNLLTIRPILKSLAFMALLGLFTAETHCHGEFATLSGTVSGTRTSSKYTSPQITLGSNEVAQVVYLVSLGSVDYVQLIIELPNAKIFLGSKTQPLPIVAGPAVIYLDVYAPPEGVTIVGACTLQITRKGDTTPAVGPVVIPDDAGLPVNVILESSADMVTWAPAQLGIYPTSTPRRFFRLRAERSKTP